MLLSIALIHLQRGGIIARVSMAPRRFVPRWLPSAWHTPFQSNPFRALSPFITSPLRREEGGEDRAPRSPGGAGSGSPPPPVPPPGTKGPPSSTGLTLLCPQRRLSMLLLLGKKKKKKSHPAGWLSSSPRCGEGGSSGSQPDRVNPLLSVSCAAGERARAGN